MTVATGPRCPACDAHQLGATEVSREATAASIAVLGERITVHHCPCGHHEVPRELGTTARSASADALPAARMGWIRGDRCRSCAAPLTMPARRTTRSVTVTPDALPVSTFTFDLPMTRCPACGQDQLPSRARHDVTVALAALLQAAVDHVSGDDEVDPADLGPLERFNRRLKRGRPRPRRRS
jgi:hypothetical protein